MSSLHVCALNVITKLIIWKGLKILLNVLMKAEKNFKIAELRCEPETLWTRYDNR